MISRLGAGVLEFVVGEDWRVALGVVVTLGATALIATVGVPAWWIAPIAILAILRRSIERAVS
jgi:pilus assembly protein TadC